MITLRKSLDRGHANHGWLDTYHTFSFADYFDPAHTEFRSLRVINEDRVDAGAGFPKHGHKDMEIVTIVLEGSLEHQDSLGTKSVIRPGEVQRMSAGTGVLHSEYNASKTDPVHLLQIWLHPERKHLPPSYEQKAFPESERKNRLRLVAAPDGRDGALTIHQDAELYVGSLDKGTKVSHAMKSGRAAWLQVMKGHVKLNGRELEPGDGAAVESEAKVEIEATDPAAVLLFDLA